MLAHYGVVPLPCRPYAPNLKGKVESAVGYTQGTGLKGLRFADLNTQNVHLSRWNERWASTRIHGTTKRQVRTMFEEERPHLQALPINRFEYYRTIDRIVHMDGHIEVDGAYYSAPPRYAGLHVIVHVGNIWLRIIDQQLHCCVREHARVQRGQRQTQQDDRPKQTPPKIANLIVRAEQFGTSCGLFAREMEKQRGEFADRSLFGLLELTRRYSDDSIEKACTLAIESEITKLRFLRTNLKLHGTELALTQKHSAIADISTYEKHFSSQINGEPE
jgi:hypothetical protein